MSAVASPARTKAAKKASTATRCLICRLLDHLVCPLEERGRNRQTEGLGGLEVDDELGVFVGPDRKVRGSGPLQDLVHIAGRRRSPDLADALGVGEER